MGNVYEIKPFDWESTPPHKDDIADPNFDESITHYVSVPFGSYTVNEYASGNVDWEYCFDDYYDEERHIRADSVEEAKAAAFANFVERILPALVLKNAE